MLCNNNDEEKFYIDLGLDEKTAKRLCGSPGGIWFSFKAIFYGCLPFVFIALFVFDVIDLKALLLLSLIWFVGDLICNFLHHIFNFIKMSSIVIPKSIEITNKNIDTITEALRRSDN